MLLGLFDWSIGWVDGVRGEHCHVNQCCLQSFGLSFVFDCVARVGPNRNQSLFACNLCVSFTLVLCVCHLACACSPSVRVSDLLRKLLFVIRLRVSGDQKSLVYLDLLTIYCTVLSGRAAYWLHSLLNWHRRVAQLPPQLPDAARKPAAASNGAEKG